MRKNLYSPLNGIAEILKREVISSQESPDAAQHLILASEDIAALPMQLMFSASQKNSHEILGTHLEMAGNFAFVGALTHLILKFSETESQVLPSPISSGCMAHYTDWLSRNRHIRTRLNGKTFMTLVEAFNARQPVEIDPPDLAAPMQTTLKQIVSHGRLDRVARMQTLTDALQTPELVMRLAEHTRRLTILTGKQTTPQELAFFTQLAGAVREVTWLSTREEDRQSSEFSEATEGATPMQACVGIYAPLKQMQDDQAQGMKGIYFHRNEIGMFSQLFGLTFSMIAASLSLANRMEWYTLLRAVLGLDHDDAVDYIRKLAEHHANNTPLDGVNTYLGKNHRLGKAFRTCYNFAEHPEAAYKAAFDMIKQALEERGEKFDGDNADIIRDIHHFYRWMSRVASTTWEFYLMACLYPYSGRYPKEKIYFSAAP